MKITIDSSPHPLFESKVVGCKSDSSVSSGEFRLVEIQRKMFFNHCFGQLKVRSSTSCSLP